MIFEMIGAAMLGVIAKSAVDEYKKDNNNTTNKQPSKEERTKYWNILKEYAKNYQHRKEDLTDDIWHEIELKTKRSLKEIKRDYAKAKEQILQEAQQITKTTAKPKDNIQTDKITMDITMTTGKVITIEVYPQIAPITVQNFVNLVNDGFYNGLTFHRVIKGFMIQGGCPNGTGTGGSGTTITGEFSANGFKNNIKHTKGVLSMARSMQLNSASSQFFIMLDNAPHLDGQYAAFGKVINGMNVIEEIGNVQTDYTDKPLIPQQIKEIKIQTAHEQATTKIASTTKNKYTPLIVGVSPSIISLIITLFKDKPFAFDANDERIRTKLKRESAIGYWLQSSETDIAYLEIINNDITFHKIFRENGLNQSLTVKEAENYQKVHYIIDFPKTTGECEQLVNKHFQYNLSDKMFQILQLELETKMSGKTISFLNSRSFQEFVEEEKKYNRIT